MLSCLTLEQLIGALKLASPNSVVVFDDGTIPTRPHSYRGYYEDLALEPAASRSVRVTVRSLLWMLERCVGDTFTGYKGGDYVASGGTRMWCSAYGQASGMAISGVRYEESGQTVIETTYEP